MLDTTRPDPPNPDIPLFASEFAFDRLDGPGVDEKRPLCGPTVDDVEAPGRPIADGTYFARMLATLGAAEPMQSEIERVMTVK